MKTVIAINGAAGRMGQRLVHLAHADKALTLGAALESLNNPCQDRDIGEVCGLGTLGVPVRSELAPGQRVDVVIDFSTPEGTMSLLKTCVDRRIPLVVATTGHTPEQRRQIEEAAHETALMMAPNMSLVVNVLFDLVRRAAGMLNGKDFDAEVIEWHHRFKKDAPSGTALHFARIIREAMGQTDAAPRPRGHCRRAPAPRGRHARHPGRR